VATIERPHKEALTKALDIFRDAMRPSLIRGLKRVRGAKVEEEIQRSLPYYLAEIFQKDLQRSEDLPSALDVNLFPRLIQSNWRDAFALVTCPRCLAPWHMNVVQKLNQCPSYLPSNNQALTRFVSVGQRGKKRRMGID